MKSNIVFALGIPVASAFVGHSVLSPSCRGRPHPLRECKSTEDTNIIQDKSFLLPLHLNGNSPINRKAILQGGLAAATALAVATVLPSPTVAAATAGEAPSPLGKKSTGLEALQFLQESNHLAPFVNGGQAIVTGGNAGIGFETVKLLAQAGMMVTLCTRRLESGNEARDLLPDSIRKRVRVQQLDLADMTSIQSASKDILNANGNNKIDLLVNNAGVSDRPQREETAQGLELQWGTNHIGHHMLTRLLLPNVNRGGRIVTLASTAHNFAIPTTDWGSGKYPSPYAQSKLSNILFAKALDDRLKQAGRSDIQSVSLHPGAIPTKIWKNTPAVWRIGETLFMDKTIDQGVATSIYCSLTDQLVSGNYYSDCHIDRPSLLGQDLGGTLRNNLWGVSEATIAAKGYPLPETLI